MAPLRFNIPLQRKDLLRGASDGQYWVENEYSIRELKTKLVVSYFCIFDIYKKLNIFMNHIFFIELRERHSHYCQMFLQSPK